MLLVCNNYLLTFTQPLQFPDQPYVVSGSIIVFIEKLDEEFTKILQATDAHSTEYVNKLVNDMYQDMGSCMYLLSLASQLWHAPSLLPSPPFCFPLLPSPLCSPPSSPLLHYPSQICFSFPSPFSSVPFLFPPLLSSPIISPLPSPLLLSLLLFPLLSSPLSSPSPPSPSPPLLPSYLGCRMRQ